MKNELISKLEDLHTEMACAVDNLNIIQMGLAENTYDKITMADGLFANCKHFQRIAKDIEDVLVDFYKL